MRILLSLVVMWYMCSAKRPTTVLRRLINSDDDVSYVDSLKEKPVEYPSSEDEYGSYQEESSDTERNTTDVDSAEVQYYMKKLAQAGPSTKMRIVPGAGKATYTPVFENLEDASLFKRRSARPSTVQFYCLTSRSTKRPFKTMMRVEDFNFSTAAVVRRKRWAADTYEDIEKLTTLDSLEKELLFSGKYQPWQRKLYALRKKLTNNDSSLFQPRRKIPGKKRLKRILRRRGGVIHEPGYKLRKRLNITASYEGTWRFEDWNSSDFWLAGFEQSTTSRVSAENESIFHL